LAARELPNGNVPLVGRLPGLALINRINLRRRILGALNGFGMAINIQGSLRRYTSFLEGFRRRSRVEAALRESEEKLRLAVDVAGLGIWRWEAGTGTEEMQWDTCCKALFGLPPDARVNYETWAGAIPPEDRVCAEANVARAIDPADPHDDTRCEYRVQHPDGTVRWLSSTGRAFFVADPRSRYGRRAVFMAGAIRDVTEVRLAEAALRASETRFRGIFEHAGTGIAIKNLEGQFQSCNPAYTAMLGYTEEELCKLACEDLMNPDDHAANIALQRRLVAGEIPSFESVTRYSSKDGRALWGHRHVSLLQDDSGKPVNIIVLVTDITERKRHEEQVSLLMREVNHRAKNMLAVVQAIARQTAATSSHDFIERFGERVQALAASQNLIVKNEWKGVQLGELIRSQLAHFTDLIDTRIALRGPPLLVSAAAAQALGMALHELATNAGKYGALSNASGRVEIGWHLNTGKDRAGLFEMSWEESGGPCVTVPSRRGFGSTVICRMLSESMNGRVVLDYPAAGLNWRFECLAQEVTGDARPPLDEPQNLPPVSSHAAAQVERI
jgi:PAS domain S-box-containing protein